MLKLSSILLRVFSLNIEVSCFKIKVACLKISSVYMFRALSFLIVVIRAFQCGLVLKRAIKSKNLCFAINAQTAIFVHCKSSLVSAHTM